LIKINKIVLNYENTIETPLVGSLAFKQKINMESYSFAGTSARRYRIVDDQKFQINKMQASLLYLTSNWCTDAIHVIHRWMRTNVSYKK
jgi:hypothetical protein